MTTVSFTVFGDPAPQGSKSAVVSGGRAQVIEGASKGQRVKHRNWRTAVAEAAADQAALTGQFPDGPLHCTVTFRVPMPASRPKKIRLLGWCWRTSTPDLDKLLRSTFDGFTAGGLIVDDSRIVELVASKIESTGWTGCEVRIEAIRMSP